MSSGVSTLLVGVIGARYAMGQDPFWTPEIFIPTMGMLLGNSMSGMAVGLSTCLSSVGTHKEHIETYLAFGASRWEAGQAVAIASSFILVNGKYNKTFLIAHNFLILTPNSD